MPHEDSGGVVNKVAVFLIKSKNMMNNIQDEFQVLKDELRKLNIEVQKVVKVGNGSMDFHEVFYKSPKYEEVKTIYVQRHNLDDLIVKFRQAYS